MYRIKSALSRRNFLRTAGVLGAGSILSPFNSITNVHAESDYNKIQTNVVPTRPFGKTKVNVPILCLGSAFGRTSNRFLRQALKMGVRLWDTASTYGWGNSERAIGRYFSEFPEDRKEIFLVTKSHSILPEKWSSDLELSLKRMNTSYIDLFLIHSITDIDIVSPPHVNPEVWSAKKKAERKIRFFGFSTHKDMAENLVKASKTSWAEGIMFSYNFRIMHTEEMKKAVDACNEAGIGLIAMKTQASGYLGYTEKITPNEKERALFDHLAKKGLTIEQAKLKAVWDDHRVASITSGITNITILQANVAAAVNKTRLSLRDKQLLDQYAGNTAPSYCASCASFCESKIDGDVPISDVLRFLMYARSYGELEKAKLQFNELPHKIRERMPHVNYRKAEQACPQRIKIGRYMRGAAAELA